MSRRKKPAAPAIDVVDFSEWGALAAQLYVDCREKHDEVLDALRKIVDAQHVLSGNRGAVVPNYARYEA
jgi:hypothetical protein